MTRTDRPGLLSATTLLFVLRNVMFRLIIVNSSIFFVNIGGCWWLESWCQLPVSTPWCCFVNLQFLTWRNISLKDYLIIAFTHCYSFLWFMSSICDVSFIFILLLLSLKRDEHQRSSLENVAHYACHWRVAQCCLMWTVGYEPELILVSVKNCNDVFSIEGTTSVWLHFDLSSG